MYVAQYDSNGVIKRSSHPNKLRILRMRFSSGYVVSVAFLCESTRVPFDISVGISGHQ